jgi:excisionase family DNA binding protein
MENPFNEILIRIDKLEAKIDGLKLNGSEKDEIFNVTETAKFLGLAKQTVYQLVSRNAIPVMKRAGKLYFSRQEIEKWLKANRRISAAEAFEIIDSRISKQK